MSANLLRCAINFFVLLLAPVALFSQPVVSQVTPHFGNSSGGEEVILYGSGFTGAQSVLFGGVAATIQSIVSDTQMIVKTAPHTPQTVHVVVNGTQGSSTPSSNDYFVYQGNWRAYTTAYNLAQCAYLDLADFSVSEPVIVGSSPIFAIATSDGTRVFVINSGSHNVSVIDANANQVTASISVGYGPSSAVLTPDDRLLLVANSAANTLSVVETSTYQVLATLNVGDTPYTVAITPDGNKAITANKGDNTISIIDIASLEVIATVPVQSQPYGVVVTADNSLAFVCNHGSNSVSAVNLQNNSVVANIPVASGPYSIALTPPGSINSGTAGIALVNSSSNVISFIDIASLSVVDTVSVGNNPFTLSITPDGSLAVVGNYSGGSLSIIDMKTRSVVSSPSITVPISLAVSPNGAEALTISEGATLYVEGFNLSPPYNSSGYSVSYGPTGIYPIADQAPLARFYANVEGSLAVFDATASSSPTGNITLYSWNFGDGIQTDTADPRITHTYSKPGLYNVTLKVTNSAGTSTTKLANYQSVWGTAFSYSGSFLFRNGGDSARFGQTIQIQAPKILSLKPDSGSHKTQVIILGTNFTGVERVTFGKKEATILSATEDKLIVSVPKLKKPGKVFVRVTTAAGTSKKSAKALFYYFKKEKKEGCCDGCFSHFL